LAFYVNLGLSDMEVFIMLYLLLSLGALLLLGSAGLFLICWFCELFVSLIFEAVTLGGLSADNLMDMTTKRYWQSLLSCLRSSVTDIWQDDEDPLWLRLFDAATMINYALWRAAGLLIATILIALPARYLYHLAALHHDDVKMWAPKNGY